MLCGPWRVRYPRGRDRGDSTHGADMRASGLRLAWSIGIAMLLGVGAARAQSVPAISFEKYTLPNGLEVILHQDHSVPLVAVDVWYHVGSGDEQQGRTGFAHLF